MMTEFKICSRCGIEQPLDNYHAAPNTPDGKRTQCKKCRKELSLEVVVLRTCVDCGKFILPPMRLHCKECIRIYHNSLAKTAKYYPTKYSKCKNKPKRLPKYRKRNHEIYKIAKEYLNSNFGSLMHDQKIESVGTYATAQIFHKNRDCGVKKKKDGTPDWDKERQEIDVLMKKTFSKKKRLYSKTQGDIIRGINCEAKE